MGLLTVTAVDVSPDLRNAQVFVTQLGADVSHREVIAILEQLQTSLRRHLARNLRMRTTPALSFRFDESLERGARLSALLGEIKAEPDQGEDLDINVRRDEELP